jgi:hypothetical protein
VWTLGCGSDSTWTPEEIGNASHIFSSLEADRRAAEIENLDEPGADDAQDAEAAFEHRQRALDLARQVRDDVLTKAHPELIAHFRGEYQRSLELFVRAWRERRPELEREALVLRERFGTWYVRHRDAIEIPEL